MTKSAGFVKKRMKDALTKKRWLVLTTILFAIALTLGTYSYYQYPGYQFSDSIYAAIRLFTLNVEIPVNLSYSWQLELARWIAAFVVVSNIAGTILLIFRQEIKLLFLPMSQDHYIIAGLSKGAYYLANDLRNSNEKVIIIEKNPANIYIDELRKKGCVIVIGDASNAELLNQVALSKAKGLVIYTSKDHENVDILLNLLEDGGKNTSDLNFLKVYVHLNSKKFNNIIEEANIIHGSESEKDRFIMDISTFNIYELEARLLFNSHPLYGNLDIVSAGAKSGHLLILGFGLGGKFIALEAIKRAHFPNGKKLSITVVDRNADKLKSEFAADYPYVNKSCDIQFVQCDVNSSEFKTLVNLNCKSFTYAVACFDNDELDYTVSTILNDYLEDIPLAIRFSNSLNIANFLNDNQITFSNFINFGDLSEVSNQTYIIQEKLEMIAKKIHQVYINKELIPENQIKWNELHRHLKDSNLAQADHIDTKLYALGMIKRKQGDSANVVSQQEFYSIVNPMKEDLSIAEHARWNAFYFASGWAPCESSFKKELAKKKKLHACLVEWDELDQVSADHQVDYKQEDRNYIEKLYQTVTESGYQLIRNRKGDIEKCNQLKEKSS